MTKIYRIFLPHAQFHTHYLYLTSAVSFIEWRKQWAILIHCISLSPRPKDNYLFNIIQAITPYYRTIDNNKKLVFVVDQAVVLQEIKFSMQIVDVQTREFHIALTTPSTEKRWIILIYSWLSLSKTIEIKSVSFCISIHK